MDDLSLLTSFAWRIQVQRLARRSQICALRWNFEASDLSFCYSQHVITLFNRFGAQCLLLPVLPNITSVPPYHSATMLCQIVVEVHDIRHTHETCFQSCRLRRHCFA